MNNNEMVITVGITITTESAIEKIGRVDVKYPSYIDPL
jgi:hypothetical protein